jgi:hypothetical protein
VWPELTGEAFQAAHSGPFAEVLGPVPFPVHVTDTVANPAPPPVLPPLGLVTGEPFTRRCRGMAKSVKEAASKAAVRHARYNFDDWVHVPESAVRNVEAYLPGGSLYTGDGVLRQQGRWDVEILTKGEHGFILRGPELPPELVTVFLPLPSPLKRRGSMGVDWWLERNRQWDALRVANKIPLTLYQLFNSTAESVDAYIRSVSLSHEVGRILRSWHAKETHRRVMAWDKLRGFVTVCPQCQFSTLNTSVIAPAAWRSMDPTTTAHLVPRVPGGASHVPK